MVVRQRWAWKPRRRLPNSGALASARVVGQACTGVPSDEPYRIPNTRAALRKAAVLVQCRLRQQRARRYLRILQAQHAIIARSVAQIQRQAASASKAMAGDGLDPEVLLQEAGRKARAYMTKAAKPTEKLLADSFLNAFEAQLRGECAPLGDKAPQCMRAQGACLGGDAATTPSYVSLNFEVAASGRVCIGISNEDSDTRAAHARRILDMLDAARKSGLALQRAERTSTEHAYANHLRAHGVVDKKATKAVASAATGLRTACACLVRATREDISAEVDPAHDFEVTSKPGIQTPVYLRGVEACGKGGMRAALTCLLMGDSGSGTCIIGEEDFNDMQRLGLARRGAKLPSSVEQIAGIGAVNLVLCYATFFLSFGGAVVKFTDVPVLSGHRGVLLGNDFHRVTRTVYDFDTCTDGQGLTREGHVILRDSRRNAVSKPVYFSHSPGSDRERQATASLAESAVPLVYNPEAVTVNGWSEAMLKVRVPAAALTGHDVAVLPLDDDRLTNLPIMVAPSLGRPDKDGYIWVRVINPSQRKVRISQLTPLARFIVDPKISGADLEFTTDEIIDKITLEPGCSQLHRDDIKHMLESRRRLFSSKLGWAHGYQHKIEIDPKETPPSLPPRRLSPEEYTALKEAIDKQMKAGLLEYCTSPYNARPMIIPKFGGGHRVVIDFRLINEQVIRSRGGSSYPLPNVETNLNSLAKAKYFTAIDLLSGFHQVELTDESKLATAFSTPWGQMCYARLPMGLTSSPGAFMMVVDSALRGLPPGIAVAYVDDILIPTDGDWSDHMRDVGLVMDRLIEAGFTVNPKKVFMGMREAPYLGYIVGAYGTKPNPERTKAIFDLVFENIRTDPGAAARFTGMISFYSRFLRNIHVTLAPFHALKGKGSNAAALLNSLQMRASFAWLKHQLATVTALTRPDYSKDFHIHVDAASTVGVGAALMQLEDVNDPKSFRPVAFWSHKFTEAERGWSVRDQECYGLVRALEEWRPYVLGTHTEVRTDHRSLQWFMTTQHADGTRIQKWVARIQHFDVNIDYLPGKLNVVGDFFSRASGRTAAAKFATGIDLQRVRGELMRCFRADEHGDVACSSGEPSVVQPGKQSASVCSAHALQPQQRFGLLVPMYREGEPYALTCSFQGDLALPAIERCTMNVHREAMRVWISESAEHDTCLVLWGLLSNAQAIRPRYGATGTPSYFVTKAISYRTDLAFKASTRMRLEATPLKGDTLSCFSNEADRAFCLRYVAEVYRRAMPMGAYQWRFDRLPKSSTQLLTAQAFTARGEGVLVSSDLPRLGDVGLAAEGPFFCDTLSDVVEAERQVHADIAETQEDVVALDLEGNLGGPRPHVALMQVKSSARLFVIDTHVVADTFAQRAQGFRSLVADEQVVKVVHCCYGDASALRVEHGIVLAGAFDTGVADSILRGVAPNSSRGLGTVLVGFLGDKAVHLTYKGKLVHTPFMFNVRPLSKEHFVYSAEDVEYCIQLFHIMRKALEKQGLLQLAFTLSDDRCVPLRYLEAEGTRIVVAIVDSASIVCIESLATGELELPSSDFDPQCLNRLSQPQLKKLLQATWVACMGEPPSVCRFSVAISSQLRSPRRVGSVFVSYGVVPSIANLGSALESAFEKGPRAVEYRLRVVPRLQAGRVEQRVCSSQQVVLQSINYDTLLGYAVPRMRAVTARQRRAAASIQRIARGAAVRRALQARMAASFAATVGKFASMERGALVVFDSTHVYVLKGSTEAVGWRFPWAMIEGEGDARDAALAGFDRYAGPALRKGSASIDFSGPDAKADDWGWCLMPHTSTLMQRGLDTSHQLGPSKRGGVTHFTACHFEGLLDHAAAFVAARHEHNGFRLAPTEHKRHPVAVIALHDTALARLNEDDAIALKRAIATTKRGASETPSVQAVALAAWGSTTIGCIAVRCIQRYVRGKHARCACYRRSAEVLVQAARTVECLREEPSVQVEPPLLMGRVALLFDSFVQSYNAAQRTAQTFNLVPCISDMLGFANPRLDKIASSVQAEVEASIAAQVTQPEGTLRDDSEAALVAGGDVPRHSGDGVIGESTHVADCDVSRHSGGATSSREPPRRILEGAGAHSDEADVDRLPRVPDFDRNASTAAGLDGSLTMPSLLEIADAQRQHPAIAPYVEYALTGTVPANLDSQQRKAFDTEVSFSWLSTNPALTVRSVFCGAAVVQARLARWCCHRSIGITCFRPFMTSRGT